MSKNASAHERYELCLQILRSFYIYQNISLHIWKKRVNLNLRLYFISYECIVKYEECNQIHILCAISNKHRYIWTKRIFIHFSSYFSIGQSIPDLGIQSVNCSFFIFSHVQSNLDLADSVNFSLFFIYQEMFRGQMCLQILKVFGIFIFFCRYIWMK